MKIFFFYPDPTPSSVGARTFFGEIAQTRPPPLASPAVYWTLLVVVVPDPLRR